MSVMALSRPDRPVADDAAKSHTLPARYYTDAGIYEHEKAAVFFRNWWLAGHVGRLGEPGDYVTVRIFEQHVFVIRGRDGQLRAFYNVCQHRGHELLEGCGRTKMITCPYHAWCYGLDGTLRAARNTEALADFDPADFNLPAVRCEVLCGFVFVNLDPEAAPMAELYGGLEEEIRSYAPELDRLAFARRDLYNLAANWKVVVDNYLECYHCEPAHKDFVDLVDMPSYRSRVNGCYSSHISGKVRAADNSAFRLAAGAAGFGFAGWFLWPNLTINVLPGTPNLIALQIIPAGPGRTVEHADWYCPGGAPSDQLSDAMRYFDQVLQPEDIGLCESVQRGLGSFGYNQGRFVVDRERTELSEHAVHHFQTLVRDALAAG